MNIHQAFLQQLEGFCTFFMGKECTCIPWMGWICHTQFTYFSGCQNPNIIWFMRYKRILLKTLMKCVGRLTIIIESKISNILLDKFVIIPDDWNAGDAHYVEFFASFSTVKPSSYTTLLLKQSSLLNKVSQSASGHNNFLRYFLHLFIKSVNSIVAIIGDRCATNRSVWKMRSCNFVGFSSHRFNLVVNYYISSYGETMSHVQSVMKNLWNVKCTDELCAIIDKVLFVYNEIS